MRALKELKLMNLHLVRELSVPSLEKLELIKMPSLERCSGLTAPRSSLSQEEQSVCLSSLRRLILHDCPSLMVSHPLPPFAHMQVLSIEGRLRIDINMTMLNIKSNELSVLDDQILAFYNLRDMRSLFIWNCPKLISIWSEVFRQLTSLVSLDISNCPNLLKPPITSEGASENSSSGNIPTFPSLKYLNISSSGIAGRWLTKMLPHSRSLETLHFHDCPQIKWLSISQPIETEGRSSLASAVALSAEDQTLLKVPSNILCSVKHLTISGCVDLEFYGGQGGFGGFTTLEKLEISECPKLGSLLVSGMKDDDTSNMDVALLPLSLKKLSIYGCPKLVLLLSRDTKDDTSNVDVGLLSPSLEAISLSNLPENLQSYSLKGLSYLKKLRLRESPRLKCVQLHSCKTLEKLQICRCEQLGVLDGLRFLSSLRSLTISSCQQLSALEGLQFLPSLRSVEIEMNPELSAAWDQDPKLQEQEQGGNQVGMLPLSIDKLKISNLTNNVQSRLLSCLPAITQLAIQGSPELTSLQLGHCASLNGLEITDCESLASIEDFQFLTNLKYFKVAASSNFPPWMELLLQQQGTCEVLSQLTELQIVGDASVLTMSLCKQLTSLQCLVFRGEETCSMVRLTEEQERALQLLTSLQQLQFFHYPNLLFLPANLRSLVSLWFLRIYFCPSISGLPEMDTSCKLHLLVAGCSEELSQQCKEWEERRSEMIDY